ncbi:hypothetical protein [Siphonobacter sp. SORGH_AS_0500]|uniref:hypothetical protein n=1 Tax=Siphonobacter sp. SORGH_AS_0500 TaxID=1864824 RepID=UPI0012FEEB00|nr:hypothetical protein [Siphonobacter sp. SORGH_AS_0500]
MISLGSEARTTGIEMPGGKISEQSPLGQPGLPSESPGLHEGFSCAKQIDREEKKQVIYIDFSSRADRSINF